MEFRVDRVREAGPRRRLRGRVDSASFTSCDEVLRLARQLRAALDVTMASMAIGTRQALRSAPASGRRAGSGVLVTLQNELPRERAKHVLFDRQRQMLALLNAFGGRAGNLDFQKLLFLYCQEPGVTPPYEFVPYKFGAFSFTSYADRRKLIERGFLSDDELHWELTGAGRKALGRADNGRLTSFTRGLRGTRGDALVAETYRRFPYYATRSEIAGRVLRGERAALAQIEAARPTVKAAAISTIGYEGRTLESYLNELLRSGVTLLCDVRRNPISRKYGFSKGTLGTGCEGLAFGSSTFRNLESPPNSARASRRRPTTTPSSPTTKEKEPPNAGVGSGEDSGLGSNRRAPGADVLRTPTTPVPPPLRVRSARARVRKCLRRQTSVRGNGVGNGG